MVIPSSKKFLIAFLISLVEIIIATAITKIIIIIVIVFIVNHSDTPCFPSLDFVSISHAAPSVRASCRLCSYLVI